MTRHDPDARNTALADQWFAEHDPAFARLTPAEARRELGFLPLGRGRDVSFDPDVFDSTLFHCRACARKSYVARHTVE